MLVSNGKQVERKGILEVVSFLVPVILQDLLQDDFLCPFSLNASWPDCWCFIEQWDLSSELVKQLSVCAFQGQLSSSISKRKKNLVCVLTLVIELGRSYYKDKLWDTEITSHFGSQFLSK